MNKTKKITYKITEDPTFLDKQNGITLELLPILDQCYSLANEGNNSSVKVIIDAIEKYPENPQLKNYLSALYMTLGKKKKSNEVNHWILTEHPNYLFGKLNLANEYIAAKQYAKVPEVIGEMLDIQDLYPERDVFHIKEVSAYVTTAIRYFCGIGDIEQAKIQLNILGDMDPDSMDYEEAAELIDYYDPSIESDLDWDDEMHYGVYDAEVAPQPQTKKTMPPVFNHSEVEELYSIGLYITPEQITDILSLPRQTLIQDLEAILEDTIARFSFFKEKFDKEWTEESSAFLVHAIFLLGELNAEKSLDAVLKVYSQSSEYIDLYLGDFLSSSFWEPLYKIASKQLGAFTPVMKLANIPIYSKVALGSVAVQVVMHQPERRSEVIEWYRHLVNFYLSCEPDDNILDSDLLGLLVGQILDIRAKELLPEVTLLYERNIPTKGICGDITEVEEWFKGPERKYVKEDILTMAERYDIIVTTWASYTGEDSVFPFDDGAYNTPVVNEQKVGRNDPCPCGSGKKHKKCCLNS